MDTSALVSGLISPSGVPGRIIRVAEGGAFEMIVSERLLSELESVLMREKFRRYATAEAAAGYVSRVARAATMAKEGEIASVSPDPKDDYLVALLREAGADHLVSGDSHLLSLSSVLPVVSPRAFLELLERARNEEPG